MTIGEVLLGVDRQEAAEALGEDVGVAVAEADLEAEDQARALGPDGPERHGRRDPHVLRGIGHRVDQQGQGARALDPREGDDGRRAQGRGGILRPAPDRLELHVPRRLQEDVRVLVLHPVEGLDDRDLGAAELVVLERVDQEAVEGRLQVPGQLDERVLAGDRRRRRDDQVRPVADALPQLGLLLGGERLSAELSERRQLVVERCAGCHASLRP